MTMYLIDENFDSKHIDFYLAATEKDAKGDWKNIHFANMYWSKRKRNIWDFYPWTWWWNEISSFASQIFRIL